MCSTAAGAAPPCDSKTIGMASGSRRGSRASSASHFCLKLVYLLIFLCPAFLALTKGCFAASWTLVIIASVSCTSPVVRRGEATNGRQEFSELCVLVTELFLGAAPARAQKGRPNRHAAFVRRSLQSWLSFLVHDLSRSLFGRDCLLVVVGHL